MKALLLFLPIIFFCSCFLSEKKEDIIYKKIDPENLKDDLKILQGIITDMHAGAYAYNSPAQLSQIFDSVSASINEALTARDFFNKVNYIMETIRCIHTDAYLPDKYYDSISIRPIFFPTPVIDINNRLYVNTEEQEVPLGSEIVSINNLKSTDIINKLKTYYHTDGYSSDAKKIAIDENFAYNFFLAYGGKQSFSVNYIEDNSTEIKTKFFEGAKLTDVETGFEELAFFYYATDVDYDLEINDYYKTATLTIRTFDFTTYNSKHAFDNFLSNSFRLINQNNIKNLIIDCRNNGGGLYAPTFSLLSYLVNKTLPESDSVFQRFKNLSYTQYVSHDDFDAIAEEDTAYLSYTKLNNGIYKLLDSNITIWQPQPDIFNGKLFVIINNHVISAATTFASILRHQTKAVFIGEETAGGGEAHNAYVLKFVLPNTQIKIDIPLRRYYQPVMNKMQGRGVIPDKIVPITVEGLINNYDEAMLYIFDSLLVK